MDIERIERYKDKINFISERVHDVKDWASGFNASDFIGDKKTRLAIYKAFQELVESTFDIAAMVHRYNGLDDSLAFDSIMEHLSALLDFSEVIRIWLRSKL
jgi:uncharacterized protein YutE (UPF0331/DUF86 family)